MEQPPQEAPDVRKRLIAGWGHDSTPMRNTAFWTSPRTRTMLFAENGFQWEFRPAKIGLVIMR
jgi:hypothetical protein